MKIPVVLFCLLVFVTIFYSNGKEVYLKVVTGNADNDFTGDNGPAAFAQVSFGGGTATFGGVWVDSSGTVYISDGDNHRVRRIDSVSGNISTIIGSGEINVFGSTGPGTSTQIYHPWFITGDTIGSAIYFTDHYNLWKYTTSDGMVTSLPGPNGKYGVWVATTGIIYMTEVYEHRIYQLDENSALTVFAGRATSSGAFIGDGGQATSAKFNTPHGIYLDATTGMFYIADGYNFRVRRINTATGIITTFVGGGTTAYPSSVGIPATSAYFALLYDVKGDRFGNIYIVGQTCKLAQVDTSGIIRSLTSDGNSCGSVLTFTLASQATIKSVYSIYVDSNAELYFCSQGLVQRTVTLDNPTGFPSSLPSGQPSEYPTSVPSSHPSHTACPTVLPTEMPTFPPTEIPSAQPSAAPTENPTEMPTMVPTIIPSEIPTAEPTILPSCTPSEIPTAIPSLDPTFVPSERPSYFPSLVPSSPPVPLPTVMPTSPTFSPSNKPGELYVKVITGTGDADFTGDNGPATVAQVSFEGKGGVWADSGGTIYIADGGNHRIRRIDSITGDISTIIGTGMLSISGSTGPGTSTNINYPWFITGDTLGSAIYFTDHYNLWKYTTSDEMVTSLPGPNSKYGVWVATSGMIYMTEMYESRIYQLDETTSGLSVFAGRVSSGTFSGDGGQATAAKFNEPKGIYLDSTTGMFYIADYNNNRIRKIDMATGIVNTFAGGGLGGPGSLATAASVNRPYDVKGDDQGNIYIAGESCQLMMVTTLGILTRILGDVGCGITLSFTVAPQVAVNRYVYSLYVDSSAEVYFCSDNLVQRTVRLESPTGFPSSLPSGQPSEYPTSVPSSHPTHTACPTILPTEIPTFVPTFEPTFPPTEIPTRQPSAAPTEIPTDMPTMVPTVIPSEIPTMKPSDRPTVEPTIIPSCIPSEIPTVIPSLDATLIPSSVPVTPTNNPAFSTQRPSVASTYFLTADPTMIPSAVPSTINPSVMPSTSKPSDKPTFFPSIFPTSTVTTKEELPTARPSTNRPSTVEPTIQPTTGQPVTVPSSVPFLSSAKPSLAPSPSSSAIPSTVPSLLSSSATPMSTTLLDSDLSSNGSASKSQSANTTVVAISASVGAIGGLLVVLFGIFYFRKKYFTTVKVDDETKMNAKKMGNLEEGRGEGEASNYLAITAGAGGGGLFQKFKNDYKILSATAASPKVRPEMIPVQASVVPSKLVFPCPVGINDFQWNGIELDPLTTDASSILLGSGSFARVFKARLKKSKEIIAIKTVTNLACELKGMDYEVREAWCCVYFYFPFNLLISFYKE
jgi:sugar lactone lactonase YvrE